MSSSGASIPAGGAILRGAGAADPLWLPKNALARIWVDRAYRPVPLVSRSSPLARMAIAARLSELVLGVPAAGALEVSAPDFAWSRDELEDLFLRDGEEIPAGYWFYGSGRTEQQQFLMRRTIAERETFTVVVPVGVDHAGGEQPLLSGRPASPEVLSRVIGLLRHRAGRPDAQIRLASLEGALDHATPETDSYAQRFAAAHRWYPGRGHARAGCRRNTSLDSGGRPGGLWRRCCGRVASAEPRPWARDEMGQIVRSSEIGSTPREPSGYVQSLRPPIRRCERKHLR